MLELYPRRRAPEIVDHRFESGRRLQNPCRVRLCLLYSTAIGTSGRRRVRERDALKKQSYIQKYIPHIGDALRDMLDLAEGDREKIITTLTDTLERSRKM